MQASYIGATLLVLLFCQGPLAQGLQHLYPFGQQDEQLKKEADVSSIEYPLSVPIAFYQNKFTTIFINDNGLVSFLSPVMSSMLFRRCL